MSRSTTDKIYEPARSSAGLATVPQQSNMTEWVSFRKYLDVQEDKVGGWEDVFQTVLASATICASGNKADSLEFASGLMQCFSVQSMSTDALIGVPWKTAFEAFNIGTGINMGSSASK
jgi:hypothetical protein